ncbi:histidine kinase [Desulfitobacterium hafniense]|uniref:histidine kinase n=1 Tax=Desulfitobacterium hafniense TaxID=49338 RepID=A0A0W1JER8_DESHA|nr:HAMP domain-containing sensor histidine kinase [Desulfitobacterium hafniense]KTE89599.1 histidine kinase [Desulfitobacterium hafniense]
MKLDIRVKFILSFFVILLIPVLMTPAAVGGNLDAGRQDISLRIVIIGIPFVAYFAVLSWYLTRNYLLPLQQLLDATQKIAEGNLDFSIPYQKENEMGALCEAFDLMRQNLKASLEQQNHLNHSRQELIASISHDLRTPLSSIRGYVEGLPKAVHDPEKLNRYLSVLKNKTALLDTLIERLFEYSQLDMGDSQGAFCLWDAKEMLESILAPVELEFADQPVQLLLARPFPSVPIEANPDQIAQVFDNLISNARRYLGEKGTIAIAAKVEGADLHISVTDDGVGIAPEDLPHVFDQFYRAEKSRSRSFGGAGLGLAICQKIIENHGGEIWAESEVGVGTRFSLRLPVLTQNDCD